MNDTNEQASEKHAGLEMRPVDWWLRNVTSFLICIGMAPTLLDMAQVKFLPSPAFTEASKFVAYFFAVSVATGSMFVFWFTSTPKRCLSLGTGKPPSGSMFFMIKLFVPCLLTNIALVLVTNLYPMVRAALSGGEITLGYTIEKVHPDMSKAARTELSFSPCASRLTMFAASRSPFAGSLSPEPGSSLPVGAQRTGSSTTASE